MAAVNVRPRPANCDPRVFRWKTKTPVAVMVVTAVSVVVRAAVMMRGAVTVVSALAVKIAAGNILAARPV